MKNEPPLIAIVGETASGKTSVAIKIAKQVDGEILCADSRTIYKQMDIGTAKPTISEQEGIPHHLIDIVEPNERFTVVQFQKMAQQCIADIKNRGRVSIIVGGSGLYIDSVLYNFQFPKNAGAYGKEALEQMNDVELTSLLNKHSLQNEQLNTKNKRHVVNALLRLGASGSRSKLPSNAIVLGLKLDRDELMRRISDRVDKMFDDGFIDEVKHIAEVYGWNNESMTGIGYRLARSHLDGDTSIDDVKEAFVKRDFSLAKRQRTWFKRNADIKWFDDPEDLISKAVEFAEQFDYNEANV
jgi:tRNA dimethylallyltransferase